MNSNEMIKQNCKKMADLLGTTEAFFAEGTIPVEQAHACIALTREYLKRMQGLEHDSDMVGFYELNPGYRPIMFSNDKAIREQIDRLEDSRDMLPNFSPPRHELMMIPAHASDAPPVQLSTAGK